MKKLIKTFLFLLCTSGSLLLMFGCKSSPIDSGKVIQAGYAVASWYGPKFHGKQTASGETYNMYDLTCAHKYLPLGTIVRITNPENNHTVLLRVNDRGPFIPGRDFDLSFGAADKLGLVNQGVSKIYYEIIGTETQERDNPGKMTDSYVFYVQGGSFAEKRNADSVRDNLDALSEIESVKIQTYNTGKQRVYRVLVGPYSSREDAEKISEVIEDNGYDTIILTIPDSLTDTL